MLSLLLLPGQFIYVKYAMDALVGQYCWSMAELKTQLPDGLASMFHRVMDVLDQALLADDRKDLFGLLHSKLLPALVMSLDSLTISELVVATGGEATEVRCDPASRNGYL